MLARIRSSQLLRPAVAATVLCVSQSSSPAHRWKPFRRDFGPGNTLLLPAAPAHCSPKLKSLPCSQCGILQDRDCFSSQQLHRGSKVCSNCTAANLAETKNSGPDTMLCSGCGEMLPRLDFAARSLHRQSRVCKSCSQDRCKASAQSSGVSRSITSRA